MTSSPPGPLAEEAARLVEALGEWARTAAGGVSMPTTGGGPECQLCPFCQLLALVRRTQPETFGHLADASASMVAALRTIVERHEHGGPRTSGVERIDLDDREPMHIDLDDAAAVADPDAADVAT
jgi:hypothetical protein